MFFLIAEANRDDGRRFLPGYPARLRGKATSSLDYSLDASAGYGTDEVEGGRFIGSVGGGIKYAVSERTRIMLDAFYSRAPSYEWGTTQTGLEMVF